LALEPEQTGGLSEAAAQQIKQDTVVERASRRGAPSWSLPPSARKPRRVDHHR